MVMSSVVLYPFMPVSVTLTNVYLKLDTAGTEIKIPSVENPEGYSLISLE